MIVTILPLISNRTGPAQFQPIPFPMRALKYMLVEIQNAETQEAEQETMGGGTELDVAEDDGVSRIHGRPG